MPWLSRAAFNQYREALCRVEAKMYVLARRGEL
jgi:hypothetical protein